MSQPNTPVPPYSPRDEVDLLWYFGIGQTAFERSTFGSALDRAENFGSLRYTWPTAPVLSNGVCIGHESAVTARPTAETREVHGYIPDDYVLTRYAHMSSLLLRVERLDRRAAATITLYFGELGNRWALGTMGHGRLGALYHLTEAGQALVKAAGAVDGALPLTAAQRIENLAIVNKAKPREERTAALARCGRQAERLEMEARAVWHEVTISRAG